MGTRAANGAWSWAQVPGSTATGGKELAIAAISDGTSQLLARTSDNKVYQHLHQLGRHRHDRHGQLDRHHRHPRRLQGQRSPRRQERRPLRLRHGNDGTWTSFSQFTAPTGNSFHAGIAGTVDGSVGKVHILDTNTPNP
ncbi:hypothetical protein [Kitasatospora sp. MBT63]|uniref:hypothetical protein n=1 Tax=Kitasatospora sp. MBT63 TaxID=1444768 RepID=UPI000B0A3D50|nr:hypothetical protein [Kitasatospora sp. MBT63]